MHSDPCWTFVLKVLALVSVLQVECWICAGDWEQAPGPVPTWSWHGDEWWKWEGGGEARRRAVAAGGREVACRELLGALQGSSGKLPGASGKLPGASGKLPAAPDSSRELRGTLGSCLEPARSCRDRKVQQLAWTL